MKTKILFLMRDFGFGGSESFTVSLVNCFDPARFDRVVAVLDGAGPLQGQVDRQVRILPLGGRQGNAFQFPWKIMRYSSILKRILYAECPQVIVADNWFVSIISCLVAKDIRMQGARLIIEMHLPIRSFFFMSSFGNLLAPLKLWLSRRLFKRADLVVAVTNRIAEDATFFLGLSSNKIKVIYNSVDVEGLRGLAGAAPVNPDLAPYLVAVGRLEHEKGQDLLLEAFAIVANDIPHCLVIVGEGSCRVSLENLALRLGIGNRVFFTGGLANPYGYMKHAECVVIPSRWESFSLVALEAFSLEVPVIAAACEGPTEIMDGGRYGILVPVGDVPSLANALRNLLQNPESRAYYRGICLSRAQEFARASMVQQYENLCLSGK